MLVEAVSDAAATPAVAETIAAARPQTKGAVRMLG